MRIDTLSSPVAGAFTGGTVTGGAETKEHARLVDAAQQFEAMLLQEMLKPMQSSENKWDKDDKDADKSMDTLSSYGVEAMAKGIAKSGGLGIAKKVVQQVTQEHDMRAKKEPLGTKVSAEQADKLK